MNCMVVDNLNPKVKSQNTECFSWNISAENMNYGKSLSIIPCLPVAEKMQDFWCRFGEKRGQP